MRTSFCVLSIGWALSMGAAWADAPGGTEAPRQPATQSGLQPARQSWLVAYCVETRFKSLAEVDTLARLSEAEKEFCKARLKLLNPMIE